MKRATIKLLAGIALIMLVAFAALNILAYNHAYSMLNFTTSGTRTSKPEELSCWRKIEVILTGVNLPRPTGRKDPTELDPDCRVMHIRLQDGIKLESWYVDRGESTPLVILFHGYGSEKTSLIKEAGIILDLGLSVMLVDFRGSGGSSESYTTIGLLEAEDVAAAFRYAKGFLSHNEVILFGRSMGAAAVLRAVNELGIMPGAVILEAVFDSMLNTVRNRFVAMGIPSFPAADLLVFWGGYQLGFDGSGHNPAEYALSLKCPALFLHGSEDNRATLEQGKLVFESVPGPKEFKVFTGLGHESYASARPGEWRAIIGDFFSGLSVPEEK